MVAVPVPTPVTMPVADPIVAIPPDPELHTPPETVAVNIAESPAQMVSIPPILPASGDVLTVTTVVVTADPQLPDTV
jgi:hypothetical protein